MPLWDKLTGNEEEHKSVAAAPNVSESHPVAKESHTQTVPGTESHGFNLSSLKDALIGGSSTTHDAKPVPPPVAVTHTQGGPSQAQKKGDWTDTFHDLLDFGASNRHEAEEERARLEKERVAKELAAKKAEEEASFTGKLKGIFKSDKEEEEERHRLAAEAEKKRKEAEEAKKKEISWTAKIRDVFDGDSEEKERERQRLLEEAKRNQSFGARIRNIFDKPAPPPPPPHSLSDKIKESVGIHHEPPHEKTIGEKIQEAFGGGSKSEQNEDKLDKAVDFVQGHVLHQGDQKKESVWEQAKDEQISDAIRKGWKNTTGHDFPIADKKH